MTGRPEDTTAERMRVSLVGVGGQGTLTATRILAQAVMEAGLDVVSGEIHGMAQRGGVVESSVLIGGYLSPRLDRGEADVMLSFEILETLRGLTWLKPGGLVLANSRSLQTMAVALGKVVAPSLAEIKEKVDMIAAKSLFIPCRDLGEKAGSLRAENTVLLGALGAMQVLPVSLQDLEAAIKKLLKSALVSVNLKALELGAEAANM